MKTPEVIIPSSALIAVARWLLLGSMMLAAPLHGADGPAGVTAQLAHHGLHWIDWTVIAVFLATTLALGSYHSRRQSSNDEYFTAAHRPMRPFFVGLSLYASLLSTISYLGKPGEMINKGPILLLAQIVTAPLAYFIVARWLIPKIMAQRVTSAYELLEARLGLAGRMLGTLLFLSLRIVWMGLLIYLAAVAVSVIVNIDLRWVSWTAAVIGLVPIIYASIGGLRAIVIIEVVQFSLLFLGAAVTIVIVIIRCGGYSWWPTMWVPEWDAQPFFSWDPYVRVTFVGAVINLTLWRVATAGGDQMAVQRYMATRDVRSARQSYAVTAYATVLATVLLAVLGLALLGFFRKFPDLLASGMSIKADGDRLFPYFIANFLPIGVSGLVVAAVISGPMSSISSGVNAITAVVTRDYLERFGWKSLNPARHLLATKFMAFGIGVLIVIVSMALKIVPGNFMEVTNKTAALETTPIFALFFLALFVPFATPLGAVVGTAYGLTVSVLIAFWDLLTGRPTISFQYIGLAGFVVDVGIACLVSRFGPARDNRKANVLVGLAWLLPLFGAVVFCLKR